MNREIKFRAWDTEKNLMIYDGVCDKVDDGWEDTTTYLSISFDGSIEGQISDDGGKNGLHEHSVELKKDRFVLMQYTGLKDKNGVEIYEGDVVKIYQGHSDWLDSAFEIMWKEGAFCMREGNRERVTSLIFYADGMQTNRGHRNIGQFIEVIGNVYQNPELLKA